MMHDLLYRLKGQIVSENYDLISSESYAFLDSDASSHLKFGVFCDEYMAKIPQRDRAEHLFTKNSLF